MWECLLSKCLLSSVQVSADALLPYRSSRRWPSCTRQHFQQWCAAPSSRQPVEIYFFSWEGTFGVSPHILLQQHKTVHSATYWTPKSCLMSLCACIYVFNHRKSRFWQSWQAWLPACKLYAYSNTLHVHISHWTTGITTLQDTWCCIHGSAHMPCCQLDCQGVIDKDLPSPDSQPLPQLLYCHFNLYVMLQHLPESLLTYNLHILVCRLYKRRKPGAALLPVGNVGSSAVYSMSRAMSNIGHLLALKSCMFMTCW